MCCRVCVRVACARLVTRAGKSAQAHVCVRVCGLVCVLYLSRHTEQRLCPLDDPLLWPADDTKHPSARNLTIHQLPRLKNLPTPMETATSAGTHPCKSPAREFQLRPSSFQHTRGTELGLMVEDTPTLWPFYNDTVCVCVVTLRGSEHNLWQGQSLF